MYVVLLVGGDDGDAVAAGCGLAAWSAVGLLVVAEDGDVVGVGEVVEASDHPAAQTVA